MAEYSSVICEWCTYTNYGEHPSGCITPNGYFSCEGMYCNQAHESYVEDTGDKTPIEDLF